MLDIRPSIGIRIGSVEAFHDLVQLPGYHALFTLEPHWRRRHQFNSRLHLSPAEATAGLAIYTRVIRWSCSAQRSLGGPVREVKRQAAEGGGLDPVRCELPQGH